MTVFLLASLFFLTLVAQSAMAEGNRAPDVDYRNALAQARDGNFSLALPILERLSTEYPQTIRYFYDYLTVLGWAEYDDEVIRLGQTRDMDTLPVYVLETIAKAARNLGQHALSLEVYQLAFKKDPKRIETRKGLMLALANTGKSREALDLLYDTRGAKKDNIDWWLIELYILKKIPDSYFEQLGIVERILKREPQHEAALRERVRISHWLGAPHRALELQTQDNVILPLEEQQNIRDDATAFEIRWAILPDKSAQERQQALENIVASLENRIHQANENSESPLRLKRDLMLAAHHAQQHEKAVTLLQAFLVADIELNPTELTAAGESLLALHEPERAQALFKAALNQEPNNFDALLGMVYAYQENEQYTQALQLIESVTSGEHPQYKVSRNNRLSLELSHALLLASTEDYARSQQTLAELLARAPYNMDVHTEQAAVAIWQGYSQKGLRKLEYVLANEADHNTARLNQLDALLNVFRFEQAYSSHQKLLSKESHLSKQQQKQLREVWRRVDSFEFLAEFNRMASTGNQAEIANISIDSWLYTPQLWKYLRLFGHGQYTSAQINLGLVRYHRAGAGLEYRRNSVLLAAELNNDIAARFTPGLRLDGKWLMNDYWTLAANYQSNSPLLPIRARVAGTLGWSSDVSLTLRLSPATSMGASVSGLRSTDGNTRGNLSVFARQKVFNRYRFKSYLRGDGYTSRNTLDTAPYFNPRWDAATYLSLENQWLTWREYDKQFEQTLSPYIGVYKQDNYAYKATGGFRYQHSWRVRNRFSLSYGVNYQLPVFDGNYERALGLFLNVWGRI